MMEDNAEQAAAAARRILLSASRVAITMTTLGGLSRNLWPQTSRSRGQSKNSRVLVDRAAVAAGLRMLRAGGNFLDGVISQEGRLLGGETFVSLNRKQSSCLLTQGFKAQLL